jgi:nitrogen regulatory protein PII
MSDAKDLDFNLILTVVNRGFADTVIEAARGAGARGGTIFYARGTGVHELEKFFAVSIQPEKEVVMSLVRKDNVQEIMRQIVLAAGLETAGRGLSIALPVNSVVGIAEFNRDTNHD